MSFVTIISRNATQAVAPAPTVPRRAWQSRFSPGWPFIWFFVGYPAWWLLGVTWLAALVAACVMVVHLYHHEKVIVPRHFGWWLLFLAWVGAGILLVQIDAPGAVPGASMTRYLTWSYRLLTFVTATVMMVYLCTFRKELPWTRVSRALGWMFVYIAIGGSLGVAAPFVHFPSLFELMLPRHVAQQAFVSSLVHPNLAQVQEYLGVVTTRPSAPFPYANSWGLNYVCFLPFFLAGWWHHGGRRRRTVSVLLLAVSLVPLVLSLNRAVWGVIAVLVIFVAARGVARGQVRLAVACIMLVCVGGATLVASPLGNTVQARLSGAEHTSDAGRVNLSTLATTSALERSAVAGYGTTRDVQGSFQSIAIGATPSCPGCSGPALGTQGIMWLLVFGFGLGGLFLYLGFLLLHFIRSVHSRAPAALLASATLLVYLLTTPFYDLSLTSQAAAFAAIAMLVTHHQSRDMGVIVDTEVPDSRKIQHYTGMVRRQLIVLLVTMCCGLILGGVWQYRRGTPYVASISVIIGSNSAIQDGARSMTLDTVAQLAAGSEVASSMHGTVNSPGRILSTSLHTFASPNSRILHLSVSDDSRRQARRAVSAAARSLLGLRSQVLQSQQTSVLDRLNSREDGQQQSIASISSGIHALKGSSDTTPLRNALTSGRSTSVAALTKLATERTSVSVQPLDVGRVLHPARVVRDNQQWTISLVSGALLGLLAGATLGRLRERQSPRLKKLLGHQGDRLTLPPVLATVRSEDGTRCYDTAVHALQRIPGVTCLGIDRNHDSCATADLLTARLGPVRAPSPSQHQTVALVVLPRSRMRHVSRAQRHLNLQGATVCGLVVVDERARQIKKLTDYVRANVHNATTNTIQGD